jgi:hypothetical protein
MFFTLYMRIKKNSYKRRIKTQNFLNLVYVYFQPLNLQKKY